ncbi:GntR family transcriptional regulator, partial [Citrobacter sp. AAK_AS5]
ELRPGMRLPGEPALADKHGVSRVTVRRALDQLADEQLIDRRPGAGTFVSAYKTVPPVMADLFRLTYLEVRISLNMNVLVDGRTPRLSG